MPKKLLMMKSFFPSSRSSVRGARQLMQVRAGRIWQVTFFARSNKLQKQHNCIPDEHYVQTLLAMKDLETELERRTVTYTVWNQSTTNTDNGGWHPFTFSDANAGSEQIKRIKDIDHVYYETEYRTEWCSNNSTSVPCFLFARKFSHGATMRLLSQGVVGNFDVSALLDATP